MEEIYKLLEDLKNMETKRYIETKIFIDNLEKDIKDLKRIIS